MICQQKSCVNCEGNKNYKNILMTFFEIMSDSSKIRIKDLNNIIDWIRNTASMNFSFFKNQHLNG